MQGSAQQQVKAGQQHQRLPPAPVRDQPGRERNEHRTSQAAQESHDDDGAAEVIRKAARDDGKHGRIKNGRHRSAQPSPNRIKARDAGDLGMQQQTERRQQGAAGHHQALMTGINPAPHGVGHQALDQQGQAECQGGLGAAQTQLLLNRSHHQGEGIKDTAPADQLCQREPGHQRAIMRSRVLHRRIMLSFCPYTVPN